MVVFEKQIRLMVESMNDHLRPFIEKGLDVGPLYAEVVEENNKTIVRFWYEIPTQ
jgi:hypothetical protein